MERVYNKASKTYYVYKSNKYIRPKYGESESNSSSSETDNTDDSSDISYDSDNDSRDNNYDNYDSDDNDSRDNNYRDDSRDNNYRDDSRDNSYNDSRDNSYNYHNHGRNTSSGYDRGGYDRNSSSDNNYRDDSRNSSSGYDRGGYDRNSSSGYVRGGYDRNSSSGYVRGGYDRNSSSYRNGSYDPNGYDRNSQTSEIEELKRMLKHLKNKNVVSDDGYSMTNSQTITNSKTPVGVWNMKYKEMGSRLESKAQILINGDKTFTINSLSGSMHSGEDGPNSLGMGVWDMISDKKLKLVSVQCSNDKYGVPADYIKTEILTQLNRNGTRMKLDAKMMIYDIDDPLISKRVDKPMVKITGEAIKVMEPTII